MCGIYAEAVKLVTWTPVSLSVQVARVCSARQVWATSAGVR